MSLRDFLLVELGLSLNWSFSRLWDEVSGTGFDS